MTDSTRAEALEECIMPILLGNTRLSHRISRNIYASCGIVSFIYGKGRITDIFDLSFRPLRLPMTDDFRLLAEAITAFCEKYPDMLPILIPCSSKAKEFTKKAREMLESRCIITEPSFLLTPSPLDGLILSLD